MEKIVGNLEAVSLNRLRSLSAPTRRGSKSGRSSWRATPGIRFISTTSSGSTRVVPLAQLQISRPVTPAAIWRAAVTSYRVVVDLVCGDAQRARQDDPYYG